MKMNITLIKWSTREGPEYQFQALEDRDEYSRPIKISPVFHSEESARWWLMAVVPSLNKSNWNMKAVDRDKKPDVIVDELTNILATDIINTIEKALADQINEDWGFKNETT